MRWKGGRGEVKVGTERVGSSVLRYHRDEVVSVGLRYLGMDGGNEFRKGR